MGSIPTRGSIPGRAQGFLDRLKIMYRLLNLWDKHPDMRLSQLVANAYPADFYYTEDLPFIEGLEKFYAKL